MISLVSVGTLPDQRNIRYHCANPTNQFSWQTSLFQKFWLFRISRLRRAINYAAVSVEPAAIIGPPFAVWFPPGLTRSRNSLLGLK